MLEDQVFNLFNRYAGSTFIKEAEFSDLIFVCLFFGITSFIEALIDSLSFLKAVLYLIKPKEDISFD